MKKLFTFIIVAGLTLAMQAQDITNTLGTGGYFIIESESDVELVNISNPSNVYTEFSFYNKSSFDTDFSIYNSGGSLDLNLMKAGGNTENPSDVGTGDILGNINYKGWIGNIHEASATISARVDGDPGSTHIPGELIFKTGTDSETPATRMTIKSDGTVNIANTLNVGGSLSLPVNPQSVDYTATAQDYLIYATLGNIVISLPDATQIGAGRIYVVKKNGENGDVTVTSANSPFDGSTDFILTTPFAYIMVQSLGAGGWMIISQN